MAFVLAVLPATAAPLSGTKTVGPTGDYASLTVAIADVNAAGNGLGGAFVLELQAAYVSTVETFPLTIPALNGASATNSLTIRPATGATGLSITSADTTAATVDLNGAQFVTIDGRPGGTGSNAGSGGGAASQLAIANTDVNGVALRFINEASGNTIRYAALRSVNTSLSSGTILFSTTTGANGNDNNTIDHCDLGDGASTPSKGIYALGTTTTAAQNNSGNTVSNCNIFNFYSGSVDVAGVWIDPGNDAWTMTGNSFYQTASRAAVAANVRAIFVNIASSGNNFMVTGNFIGGSAPNAGGTAWTTTGVAAAYLFRGIQLRNGVIAPSSVQGNTIANIVWTSSSNASALPGVWIGIFVNTGSANVGTVAGNTIGTSTGTGSVSVTTSGNGGTAFGIGSSSSFGTVAIANNTIGSITVNGSANSVSASLTGIQVTAGANTISNNTVGSTATPSPLTSNLNSLNAATSSTSATGQQVTGILSSSSTSATITGNTVANLNNNYAGAATAGQILGIVTTDGLNTIVGNTIRNLSTTSLNGGLASSASVLGIIQYSVVAGQTVSQNVVHSLANTAASAAVQVSGIYYFGGTGTNIIAKNLVHSLGVSSTSAASSVKGIHFRSGVFTAQNNMVRVGIHADGSDTAGASDIRGIVDGGSSAGRNFYHNSVYLGGTQTSGAANTVALDGGSSVSNARSYQNNIIVNARGNSGGTGKHYAVMTANPTGLTAGGNIFLVSGTGGLFGQSSSIDRATLAAWRAATGQDASSVVADPFFVAPTGTAATMDLHLQPSNPAEGGGIALTDAATGAPATVTDDFDSQTRSTLTPTDIGADAGNFILSSDVLAPVISYPLLSSGSTANRVLTGWASIRDNSGTVASGANAPRLYFKKSTDADAFGVANNSTGNGWKYVIATGSGPYSFTMDYSLLNGGGVAVGNTIQYFVVAQDAVNGLGSSPAFATASANPPVQNVNGHGAVNSFGIVPTMNGTVTVGSGGTYPSLSGAGGLFAALNGVVLTGNVAADITSDLAETGGVTLNVLNSNEYPPTRTLTIQPDNATMRTISGDVNGGLITLNGADRVTIDGRFGSSGRYLTFRNTNTGISASTLLFINDSSDNIVRNCVVEGTGTFFYGVISFRTGSVTGNDNNLITGCQVRDLSTAVGVPYALIGSLGGSAVVANSNNTISDNDLSNFSDKGIYIDATGNESWTISGNEIHEVNTVTGFVFAVDVWCDGTNVIMGNSLHDLTTTATQSVGIHVDGAGTTTISRNRFTAFTGSDSTTNIMGVWTNGSAGSTLNVVNNQITVSPATAGSMILRGIYDSGSTGGVVNAFYNSVLIGGTESGTRSSWASERTGFTGGTTHTARNNLFLNFRTGGGVSHFAAGSEGAGDSYVVSNNVYAGTGATASSFMDFNTTGGAVPVSFATWQTLTGDTASQAGIAGSGSFTTALFANAATGDLHLVPGGNVLVNKLGTPIPGVADDYDGDVRSPTAPTIGADEIPLADIALAQASALADGGSVDFGTVTLGSSSAAKTFTITNPGSADLSVLAVTGGTGEFSVSALSGTGILVGSGSVTFTVTFTPSAGGARSAVIHIASNVTGTKNPFDIALTGTGQTAFQAWAATNGVANDPNAVSANGQTHLVNFAFGISPTAGGGGPLVFNGTLAGGTLGVVGLPVTWVGTNGIGTGYSALFIRRKDAAVVGLTYSVEFSAEVTAWVASAATPTVLTDDGTYEVVGVPYPPLVNGAEARFSRVRVTLAP